MSHGKRYTVKERKEILDYLENHTYQETMEKFQVSQMSLARWVKNKEKRETNTTPSLLPIELTKIFHIHLKIIENLDNVRAVAMVSAAGELILADDSKFHLIFKNIQDISVITSHFLLCAKGFTAAAVNEQKNKNSQFDDVSIKTTIGTFFMKSLGSQAVLVILFIQEYNMVENFKEDMQFIDKIRTNMMKVLSRMDSYN